MALPPPAPFPGPPAPPPPGPAPNARCDFAAWALLHPIVGIANPSTWVPPQCSPFPPVLHETCKKPLPAMWQPAMNPIPQPHTVCQACYDLHHTSLESNYIAPARQRLRRVSPPVGWNNPNGNGNVPPVPFARFLTRLCAPCERVELDKITLQINQRPSLVPPVDVALADKMRDYPRWQCTCYLEIGWAGLGPPGWFVPAPPLARGGPGWVRNWPKRICKIDHILNHMNMNATRVTNDNWLRNVARNGSGQVVTASAATKTLRDAIGSYRACRYVVVAHLSLNGLR